MDCLPLPRHCLALLHLTDIQEIFHYMQGNFGNFFSVTFRRQNEKSTSTNTKLINYCFLLFFPQIYQQTHFYLNWGYL
jgi:hypothetical protein